MMNALMNGNGSTEKKIFSRLRKPWFKYRPWLLTKALLFDLGLAGRGWKKVRTCFGAEINCDTSKIIGQILYRNGVYELATSELVWQLLKQEPNALFVDAGANIGYYSLLARQRLGKAGEVIAFEPVPDIYEKLAGNLQGLNVRAYQYAISSEDGIAQLSFPQGSDSNDGISTLQACENALGSFSVTTISLDNFIKRDVFILKIDVEGHEYAALSGASSLLAQGGIKHILFEEHEIESSAVVTMLVDYGYKIFSIGWDFDGLLIRPLGEFNSSLVVDAPNFIATLDVEGVVRASRSGWSVLQGS